MQEITVDELAVRRDAGAFVLDVRNPDEHMEARVPGVVLIPLPELDARWIELPADETVLVICRSGARSARAVEVLQGHGLSAINVTGGTLAWIASGRPVDDGPDTTGSGAR
ncbi:MAG: rhodanese-like domain-containing protein [Actinobacteria bacterium]|nr:rhodanese-like domain-containing protein [Actinomycetota bacterium]